MSSHHHEKKALKHQDKARKHQHKDKHHSHSKHSHHDKHHLGTVLGATTLAREGAPVVHTAAVPVVPVVHTAAVPVVPMQGLSLADRVVHEPEQVIRHAPLIEKEIVNERTLEVKREHHIQPIVHETEHRIQPIIKTEATTEQPVIVQDRNVMLAPVVERAALPAGLEAVERVAPEGIIHAPKVETLVVNERPVEINHEHHIQPVIHERVHHIQPVIKTEVTTEQRVINQEHTVMLPPIIEPTATVAAQAGGLHYAKPLTQIPVVGRALATEERLMGHGHRGTTPAMRDVPLAAREGALGTTAATTVPHKPTMGQRLKGAVKQLQGSITGNELKKEEGKLISEGVDPATARAATTSTTAPIL
ncbi:uncharacterized protein ACA1_139850 [Acanthamoeba castellanii str. Neff]|uniref:Uncharacterized protein n=1 Tax=Acanthamoeba castellanii (strain ATCC 30010 / Neff) TaxID=1257118 RepID=L8GHC0_ACACF|nr:uncharacterized protein ACA1_139850 [Acanthamoeba castellanii str. Neff]ELR12123.1 hypothetical protein ACA1_139850 [Acanthamoeba castellanii str. Neff]